MEPNGAKWKRDALTEVDKAATADTAKVGLVARARKKLDVFLHGQSLLKVKAWFAEDDSMFLIARILLSFYFVHTCLTAIGDLRHYHSGFTNMQVFEDVLTLACSLALPSLVANKYLDKFGWLLLTETFYQASTLLYRFIGRVQHRSFYFDELMLKKTSLLGVVALVMFKVSLKKTSDGHMEGLILQVKKKFGKMQSIVLLVVRLLLVSLFLAQGISEIRRQLATDSAHARRTGDGHDQIVYKILSLLVCMPLAIGFRTKICCLALSVVCSAEALIQWTGLFYYFGGSGFIFDWAQLGNRYGVHAREHFCVNCAVAGGLLLLSRIGGGRYTADALMKKTD